MRARLLGLCKAALLCNAPSTERELSALRTAVEWMFALRVVLCVAVRPASRGARCSTERFVLLTDALCSTDLFGVAWTATDRLPRKLDRADEWDIAGPALK